MKTLYAFRTEYSIYMKNIQEKYLFFISLLEKNYLYAKCNLTDIHTPYIIMK